MAALKARPGAVKGLAHITGGGLVGNVNRALPDGLRARLDGRGWEVPAVFGWLKGRGRRGGEVEAEEMVKTFNCGVGMAVVVGADEAEAVKAALEKEGERVYTIGVLETREAGAPQVVIDHLADLFP